MQNSRQGVGGVHTLVCTHLSTLVTGLTASVVHLGGTVIDNFVLALMGTASCGRERERKRERGRERERERALVD